MNRLIIGLGTIACLGFCNNAAFAANGSIAASMTRDYWLAAARRDEARARQATLVAQDRPAPALTRPRADSPRPAR